MADLIRWESNGFAGLSGYPGTGGTPFFAIVDRGEAPMALLSSLPGPREQFRADDPEPLKAEAERLLREFAASVLTDSEMYMAGAAAERERVWSLPVNQRLELHGGYPGGVYRCAGCLAELTEGRIAHQPKCSEMRLAGLIGDDDD